MTKVHTYLDTCLRSCDTPDMVRLCREAGFTDETHFESVACSEEKTDQEMELLSLLEDELLVTGIHGGSTEEFIIRMLARYFDWKL